MEAIERAIRHFGSQVALANALGISQPTVSEWRTGERPVPPGRCPDIESLTGVRCEDLRSDLLWVRIPDPKWPHGKPLLDKATPTSAPLGGTLPPLQQDDFPQVRNRSDRGSVHVLCAPRTTPGSSGEPSEPATQESQA